MLRFLLAPLIAFMHLYTAPLTLVSMVDQVRASVVHVQTFVQMPDGSGFGVGFCTGEVVAKDVVLTAAHCAGSTMLVDGREATVTQLDIPDDLAILVTHTLNKPVIVMRDQPVKFMELLTGIGYVKDTFVVVQGQAFSIGVPPPWDSGSAAGILINHNYVHGMSGGPVVDADGQMVGIIQQTDENIGYGVGIQTIKAFLEAK